MPDVFISYNREDRNIARVVASALEAEGFSVWWDAALRAGETYDEVTEKNLREAGAVVVLWSKRSANSKWVRAEATVGERSSTLVPALIEECDRPVRFELVQTADLTRWKGDRADPNWRGLVQDIKSAAARRPKVADAQREAARTSDDVTIETTFWNSIKDGAENSDFEAYLARYPNGHFAALAKNRIAAMGRAQEPARAAPAPAPARAAPPPQRAPSPPPQSRAPQPAPAAAAKGGGKIMVAVVAVVILGLGVSAVFLARNGKPQDAAVAASTATPATTQGQAPAEVVAAQTTEPPATDPVAGETADGAIGEPAIDMLAETTTDAQLTEEVGAAEADALQEQAAEAPAGQDAAGAGREAVDAGREAAAPQIETAPPAATAKQVKPGKTYRDCDACPLMASLPAGSFTMGSPSAEIGRNGYEGPQRQVAIERFAMGVYEVTAGEWNACVADGACEKKGGEGEDPVLGVSWRDAQSYTNWLSKKTKNKYRLPTEAEWEYAARAGTVTAYWWGDRFDRSRETTGAAKPVGSAKANAFGLYDMLGNAREWVEDCYVNNYSSAPTDGSAVKQGDCVRRVIRGGAWSSPPADMRAANRSRIDASTKPLYMGFRVVAER